MTTRDRTCRMPNCGQRVGWADLDHVIPHSCDGPTSCTNLCCLCRTDHRLKTFARGWRFVMDPDGTLERLRPRTSEVLGPAVRRSMGLLLGLLEGDDGPAEQEAVAVGQRVGDAGLELGPLGGLRARRRACR